MSDPANVSILLNEALEPGEKEKVERLDGSISERFRHAELTVRLCRGSGTGEHRLLTFFSDIAGMVKVGSIGANDFVTSSDQEAVAMIELSGS